MVEQKKTAAYNKSSGIIAAVNIPLDNLQYDSIFIHFAVVDIIRRIRQETCVLLLFVILQFNLIIIRYIAPDKQHCTFH